MHVAVLAGGIGAARFLRGLVRWLSTAESAPCQVSVIGNTADDITLHGLRVCPDLDTVMYTLGGGICEDRGWGRAGETFSVREELMAYGVEPLWFTLGDRDLATHLVRTQMLDAGYPLSAVTRALCERWLPGGRPADGGDTRVRLLPMTDDRVETHVVIEDTDDTDDADDADDTAAEAGRRAVHFQDYWVHLRATPRALAVVPVGAPRSRPAPGVLEALHDADTVLLAPSNPVVSIGTILAVPGVREALRGAPGPVVGLSPIVGGAPVRGMADRVLEPLGVEVSAAGVARHYGSRSGAGVLDGWLVDERDAEAVPRLAAGGAGGGIACRAVPLLMSDVGAAAAMAGAALALAAELAEAAP